MTEAAAADVRLTNYRCVLLAKKSVHQASTRLPKKFMLFGGTTVAQLCLPEMEVAMFADQPSPEVTPLLLKMTTLTSIICLPRSL